MGKCQSDFDSDHEQSFEESKNDLSGHPQIHNWLEAELEDGGTKSKHFPTNRIITTSAKTFTKEGVPCKLYIRLCFLTYFA